MAWPTASVCEQQVSRRWFQHDVAIAVLVELRAAAVRARRLRTTSAAARLLARSQVILVGRQRGSAVILSRLHARQQHLPRQGLRPTDLDSWPGGGRAAPPAASGPARRSPVTGQSGSFHHPGCRFPSPWTLRHRIPGYCPKAGRRGPSRGQPHRRRPNLAQAVKNPGKKPRRCTGHLRAQGDQKAISSESPQRASCIATRPYLFQHAADARSARWPQRFCTAVLPVSFQRPASGKNHRVVSVRPAPENAASARLSAIGAFNEQVCDLRCALLGLMPRWMLADRGGIRSIPEPSSSSRTSER